MADSALIVIDIQNDYFSGGLFPLWEPERVLDNILGAVAAFRSRDLPIFLVRHVASAPPGKAPFFNEGTLGAALHPRLIAAAPGAPVIVKSFADSFHETSLSAHLERAGIGSLCVCGMMTQNCVTHTVLSKAAEPYDLAVLTDCCTTVSDILNRVAFNALSTRIKLQTSAELFGWKMSV